MRKLFVILLVLLIAGPAFAAGRGELLKQFRDRTGEPDSLSSFYSDSTALDWLNKGIQRVAYLSRSYHREQTFPYSSSVNVFEIPATRGVRAIFAKVGTRWYDITGDQRALSFSVTRVDTLTSRVYVQVGGFVQRETTISYSPDSLQYSLPIDFREVTGVMGRYGYAGSAPERRYWRPLINNPGTLLDTNVGQYNIFWRNPDSAFFRTLGLLTYREERAAYLSSGYYTLDDDIDVIKSILVFIDDKWYDITDDKEHLRYTLTRFDFATAKRSRIYVEITGVSPSKTNILYSEDSLSYHLPANFEEVQTVRTLSNGEWGPVIQNTVFLIDTNVTQYDISWNHPDTAILTLKTEDLMDGDTIVVSYLAGPVTGDSIVFSYYVRKDNLQVSAPISISYLAGPVTGDSLRISYYAQPTLMASGTDSTCVLDDDLEGFVLEEAMRYQSEAIRNYQGGLQIWQQIRQDLGGGQ